MNQNMENLCKSCSGPLYETTISSAHSSTYDEIGSNKQTIFTRYNASLKALLLADSIFLSFVQAGIIFDKDDYMVRIISFSCTGCVLTLYLMNNSPITNTIRRQSILIGINLNQKLTECSPNIWTISSLILIISWAAKMYQAVLYLAYSTFVLWIFNLDDITQNEHEQRKYIKKIAERQNYHLPLNNISNVIPGGEMSDSSNKFRSTSDKLEEEILRLSLVYERLENTLVTEIEDIKQNMIHDTRQITKLRLNIRTLEQINLSRTDSQTSNGIIHYLQSWTISSTKKFLTNYVLTKRKIKIIRKIHSLLLSQKRYSHSNTESSNILFSI